MRRGSRVTRITSSSKTGLTPSETFVMHFSSVGRFERGSCSRVSKRLDAGDGKSKLLVRQYSNRPSRMLVLFEGKIAADRQTDRQTDRVTHSWDLNQH